MTGVDDPLPWWEMVGWVVAIVSALAGGAAAVWWWTCEGLVCP